MALLTLSEMAAVAGEWEEATRDLLRALMLAEHVNDPLYEAGALINLGIVELGSGNNEQAADRFRQALSRASGLRSTYIVVACLDGVAAVTVEEDPSQTARLFALSDALRHRTGMPRSSSEERLFGSYIETVRDSYPEIFREHMRAAESVTIDDGIAAVMERRK